MIDFDWKDVMEAEKEGKTIPEKVDEKVETEIEQMKKDALGL
jgi:hypothetical protein